MLMLILMMLGGGVGQWSNAPDVEPVGCGSPCGTDLDCQQQFGVEP